mgnify:FL=1
MRRVHLAYLTTLVEQYLLKTAYGVTDLDTDFVEAVRRGDVSVSTEHQP